MNFLVLYFQLLITLSVFVLSLNAKAALRNWIKKKEEKGCNGGSIRWFTPNLRIQLLGIPKCEQCTTESIQVLQDNGSYYISLPNKSSLPKNASYRVHYFRTSGFSKHTELHLCKTSEILEDEKNTPFHRAILAMMGFQDQKCPLNQGKYLITPKFHAVFGLNDCDAKLRKGTKFSISLYSSDGTKSKKKKMVHSASPYPGHLRSETFDRENFYPENKYPDQGPSIYLDITSNHRHAD